MKMLIIGGSEFVGPLVVSRLYERGHDITVFNRGRTKIEYQKGVNFIKGDRRDGFNIKENFDVVIDMCAYKGEHIKKAINELNFDFYLNIGTAASYKKTTIFPLTEESEIGDWPLWNYVFGGYNKGKMECEKVLQKSGINHATIRPVYILGKNNNVDREHYVYSRIKNKQPLILPGDGKAKVQFVFSQDVADSIVLLAERKLEGNFNCAGDEVVILEEFVEIMADIVGVNPEIRYNPNADGEKHNLSEFPFANENFYCTNDKLKKLRIKFTPLISGLKKDYEEYYKNVI